MFMRFLTIGAWAGFIYLAMVHNTNWLFWLCVGFIMLDRWIIQTFVMRVLLQAVVVLNNENKKLERKLDGESS